MKSDKLIDDVKHWLNYSDINLFEVSRATGIAYNTLRSLKAGTGNPTIETIRKLERFLWTSKKGKSCKDCQFCLAYDPDNNVYGCEIVMAGADEDPISCQMHKEK